MPNSARSLVTPVGVPTPIGESAQSRLSGATPKKTPSMPTPGSNTKEITQSTSSGRKKQGKDKNQRAKVCLFNEIINQFVFSVKGKD